jgi:hydrogenase maturation protein HypF
MPGGEKAITEPWRMAVSYIMSDAVLGEDMCQRLFPDRANELKILNQMMAKGINSPKTSSCGRLFDALAAILGIKECVSYEGQAAVLMESLARKATDLSDHSISKIDLIDSDNYFTLSSKSLIRSIIDARISGKNINSLSFAFHKELINGLFAAVIRIKEESGINNVALSGGCFQNLILLEGLQDKLAQAGFRVYINREVPANDGGIALGQAYWGIHNCN